MLVVWRACWRTADQARSVNGRGGAGAWRPSARRRRTRQAPELAGGAAGLGGWPAWPGARAATVRRGRSRLLTFVLPLERLDGHVPGVLLRTGRVRTVRVAVLASHTSRIGTRALNLHERRGRRPAGGDSVDLPPQHRRDSVASAAGIRLGSGAPSHRAVQASSRYSETWMFSQLPRCAIDSARADRRLPASISRAGISLRRRGT